MKRTNLPIVGLALVAIVSMGLISPASATVDRALKATTKPTPITTSACYKAKLAKAALASVQHDADNAISIVNSMSTLIPSLKSSYSSAVTYGDLSNALNSGSPIYAKVTTYANAIPVAVKVLNNSSSKAFKNVVAVKTSPSNALDALASLNAFKSIFNIDFPTDSGGVVITTRNIQENTNTLISVTNKAYARIYPAFATNYYTQASSLLANEIGGFNYVDYTNILRNSIAGDVSLNAGNANVNLNYFDSDYNTWNRDLSPWAHLLAWPDYSLSELNSIATLIQQVKLSANAALLKLPKC